jgi:AcrR family transcriptional regulator
MRGAELVESRAQRRAELLDAADRVIRRHGPTASMDEIAGEAGITKPILYRHFGDKDGLYAALAERYVDALMAELGATHAVRGARAQLAARIDAYLSFVEREPEQYRFLLGAAEQPTTSALVAQFRRRLADECALATAENLRRAGLDPAAAEPWAHGIVGMIRSAGIWWLETRSVPRARLVESLTTLLWQGVSQLGLAEGEVQHLADERGLLAASELDLDADAEADALASPLRREQAGA